jgi:hypothetical protein
MQGVTGHELDVAALLDRRAEFGAFVRSCGDAPPDMLSVG